MALVAVRGNFSAASGRGSPFHSLEVRTEHDPNEHVKEIYAHFGLALYLAQVLEHGLVIALVYADMIPNRKPNQTRADFDLFLDKHFETTMGKMIQHLKKHVAVPIEFEQLLLDARTKRNFLAHHYFRERADDFMKEAGREKMILELKAAQNLFEQTDDTLSEVVRPLRIKLGFTDEMVEASNREYIAKINPDL